MKKIWEDFHERLYHFILTKVSNPEEAKDILQEVFIKIYQKKDSLNNSDKLTSWVFQICRNTIIDYYRKSRKKTTELTFDIAAEENIEQEMCSCLSSFINELPEQFKEIIQKTTFENQSLKEFATEKDLTYAAVKSRIQRARKALKKSFLACCHVEADKYGNILSLEKQSCDC